MAAADFTFLPWTRRGLAGRADVIDTPTAATLPAAHAEVTAGLTLTGTSPVTYPLTLYGPGDVLGIDPRQIVRTDPRPNSTDVKPNYIPVIEFDLPDFPWMFTPASSGPDDRLRPWCVLITVDLQVVDPPRVERGRPLPILVVPRSAVSLELPDLAESWAWAHTQVVASPGGGTIASQLESRPAMNISRLLAPRRLEPGKRYAACLVPAFDAGAARGLEDPVADVGPLGPAWTTSPDGDVVLPVYFHWEFSTGSVGDFEDLARRLRPYSLSPPMGGERMYIGSAGPELPAIPLTDPEGYLNMDAALRPWQGSPGALTDVPVAVRLALGEALDAAAATVTSEPNSDTSALGPPIYGAWPTNQHTVPTEQPVWLRELNLDPRTRAAAGLGAEIERRDQEQFMQWCWEQVEQILEANRLLSRARLSLEALTSLHVRHYTQFPDDRLLQITAPLHSRTRHGSGTVAAMISRSGLPDATTDPALRRLTSPQRPVLRAAMARSTQSSVMRGRSPQVRLVRRLAQGDVALQPDPAAVIPHGLLGIPAVASLPAPESEDQPVDLSSIGLPVSVVPVLVEQMRGDAAAVANNRNPTMSQREDLGMRMLGEAAVARYHEIERELVGDEWPYGSISDSLLSFVEQLEPLSDIETAERLTGALSRLSFAGLVSPLPFIPAPVGEMSQSLVDRIDPRVTVPRRIATMLVAGEGNLFVDPPTGLAVAPTRDRMMAAPEIDVPIYHYLARLDPARLVPGAGEIPDNVVTVLETNPRFVEALMVGLNDEMNRELLWREFPTDQRGTPFRHFWDRRGGATDIDPVRDWPATNGLGANGPGGPSGQIALLVRGQLLQRFPNTSIFAWRSRDGAVIDPPSSQDDLRYPVFGAALGVDTTVVGFDLSDDDLAEGDGWFFVLQEQPTEPRFGFDEFVGTGVPPSLTSWSDATWEHTDTPPGRYLRLADNPLAGVALGNATFVSNAAHLAAITLQKPMRVAFHAGGLPRPAIS